MKKLRKNASMQSMFEDYQRRLRQDTLRAIGGGGLEELAMRLCVSKAWLWERLGWDWVKAHIPEELR